MTNNITLEYIQYIAYDDPEGVMTDQLYVDFYDYNLFLNPMFQW